MKINVLNEGPEIFKSFQGEGRNAGKECVFIRLKGCNLNCGWCDTKDSWNNSKFDEGTCTLNVEKVAEIIRCFGCKSVVITGGEPLIQSSEVEELIKALGDFYIEIETNGTFSPIPNVDKWNVSPKLSHSNMPEERRINRSVLEEFAKIDNADFKFVIEKEDDIDEVITFCNELAIPYERVFLMPLGSTKEELDAHMGVVKMLCEKYGFMFSDRLHVQKFGNKRGV